jgi:hypothetical protein
VGADSGVGQDIVIRRGNTTLPPQEVRLTRGEGSPYERDTGGAQAAHASIVVQGKVDLDIELGDRFNDGFGHLYIVIFIAPPNPFFKRADAYLMQ